MQDCMKKLFLPVSFVLLIFVSKETLHLDTKYLVAHTVCVGGAVYVCVRAIIRDCRSKKEKKEKNNKKKNNKRKCFVFAVCLCLIALFPCCPGESKPLFPVVMYPVLIL